MKLEREKCIHEKANREKLLIERKSVKVVKTISKVMEEILVNRSFIDYQVAELKIEKRIEAN